MRNLKPYGLIGLTLVPIVYALIRLVVSPNPMILFIVVTALTPVFVIGLTLYVLRKPKPEEVTLDDGWYENF